jgi:hypothetical protein
MHLQKHIITVYMCKSLATDTAAAADAAATAALAAADILRGQARVLTAASNATNPQYKAVSCSSGTKYGEQRSTGFMA